MKTIRLATAYLALIAILFRALIPAGWMPNPSGAAALNGQPIIICTAEGGIHLLPNSSLPNIPSPGQQAPDTHQGDACPFAAAPHLATPATPPVYAPMLAAVLAAVPFAPQLVMAQRFFSSRQPRAPPV